ncbi:MAG TPA: TrkH family potassium uptake protein [Bacteroidales bacterium]|nr:TrkH family potassium uptake protein [Bacteroidales bacterium]
MINYRIIARVFSILLIFEGFMMLFAALISVIYQENTSRYFFYSALLTTLTGILTFTPLKDEDKAYGSREGHIIVAGIWVIFALFGTLPYLFSGTIHGFTNAFFESMSGFTTTGATIVTDIDTLPKGILFWRSLTQWIGGMGVIFLSLYILPVFRDLNIQLSTTEFAGQASDKIHPKVVETVKRLVALYIILTLGEIVLLNLAGMSFFDSVCQSFSTLSTGGFSTHNNSLAVYSSPYIKIILTIFMFLAGTNMTIVYFGAKRNFGRVSGSSEFLYYMGICVFFSLLVSGILFYKEIFNSADSLINGTFQVISIISSTGFYTSNYGQWGNFAVLIILVLMLTGGTTGSASGGIKITRLMLMARNNRMELRRLIHPNAYIPVRVNNKIVPHNLVYNTLVFVALYFLIICASSLIISFMGFDLITSFSTSASMLGNIGPSIGAFGPFSTYAAMPGAGKLFLSALMLLGRLELMTVLILFARSFYRK